MGPKNLKHFSAGTLSRKHQPQITVRCCIIPKLPITARKRTLNSEQKELKQAVAETLKYFLVAQCRSLEVTPASRHCHQQTDIEPWKPCEQGTLCRSSHRRWQRQSARSDMSLQCLNSPSNHLSFQTGLSGEPEK